jgi:hypothetical protein
VPQVVEEDGVVDVASGVVDLTEVASVEEEEEESTAFEEVDVARLEVEEATIPIIEQMKSEVNAVLVLLSFSRYQGMKMVRYIGPGDGEGCFAACFDLKM